MEDLGEAISKLFFRADRKKMEEIGLHLLTNNVTIDIEMLSAFMEALVVGDVACRFIITVHNSSLRGFNLEIMQEVAKPLNLTRGSSKGSILCLSRRPRNSSLFLGFPGNKRGT